MRKCTKVSQTSRHVYNDVQMKFIEVMVSCNLCLSHVCTEDIEVIVYEELPDGSTWREKCEFGPTDVHKQVRGE